jgi:predicted Fe-S protein YdhL (DUF1289 family)
VTPLQTLFDRAAVRWSCMSDAEKDTVIESFIDRGPRWTRWQRRWAAPSLRANMDRHAERLARRQES